MERYWERDAQRDEKTIESLHQYALSRSGSVVQSVQKKHTLQLCVTQKATTSTWILDNTYSCKKSWQTVLFWLLSYVSK